MTCVHSMVSCLKQQEGTDLSHIRTLSSHILDMCVAAQKHGLDTGQLLEGLTALIAVHSEVSRLSESLRLLIEWFSLFIIEHV